MILQVGVVFMKASPLRNGEALRLEETLTLRDEKILELQSKVGKRRYA